MAKIVTVVGLVAFAAAVSACSKQQQPAEPVVSSPVSSEPVYTSKY
ncbi:hypothetical protein [Pontibaca methylaminivorans]|uniref:Lipoprotein-attachment site-containing protein n=1 Tax=Pontibaca methylaminivorans TaxID=515897 RepID=A0A1R3WN39_9RHOB|nr:hypothetical protein [Pontibaca methylaminivorans]SIT79519.1 hypothetical protein SAMN05421849_1154 [Pontibaca methylaminivorans]